ncbi:MAG: hypothetical protein JWP66_1744 [Naasia sp.]|nr:hypothetical protein [Naasia sp.]
MTALPLPASMAGRTVVITGGSSGIGAAAAGTLAALGAEVAVVGRTPVRTRQVAEEVGGEAFLADFTRLDDVRTLAARLLERYPRISVLANNAGAMHRPRERTGDGYERTLQESVLGGVLLTSLLLPRLAETAAAEPPGSVRVLFTASSANVGGRLRLGDLDLERGPWFGGWRAYCNAKLANVLNAREVARRAAADGVTAYAFHPGVVSTRFGGESPSWNLARALTGNRFGLSPEQGAEPLVRLAAGARIDAPSGSYFARLRSPGPVARQGTDDALARALWAECERRVGL